MTMKTLIITLITTPAGSDIKDFKQRDRERERRRLRKITFLIRSLLLYAGR